MLDVLSCVLDVAKANDEFTDGAGSRILVNGAAGKHDVRRCLVNDGECKQLVV